MKTRIVLAVLALGLVVACSSTSGVKKFGEYPPRSVDAPVTVWLDGNPPGDLVVGAGADHYRGTGPKGHVVIAEMSLRKGAADSWETLIKEGKVEVRKLGGHGMVIRWKSGYTITAPRVAVTVFRRAPKPAK